jgi:hypothetical protein
MDRQWGKGIFPEIKTVVDGLSVKLDCLSWVER